MAQDEDLTKQLYELKSDINSIRADLKSEISIIKADNEKIYEILDRISNAMDKLTDYYNKLSMETYSTSSRITAVEKFEENFEREVQYLKEKLAYLEKWVWLVTGGGVVVGFILSNLTKFI